MPEMKDSGIEWIGQIPSNWKCCKQKYEIRLINGRAYSDSEFEEDGTYRILRVGNLFSNPVWYTSSMELYADKYCEYGDLLYSWSMSYAPVIWTGEKVIFHYHIWKVQLKRNLDKKFAFYYLIALTDALKAEIHETTMGFITMGIMNNSYIAFPAIGEQQRIAAFLDAKCAEIDALTADIQSQIDTLEQYRRSVITEAVTKGLNPDAEMRDSGIDCVPLIPEKWKGSRFKYIAAVMSNLVSPEGYEDYPQVSPDNIEKNSGRLLSYNTVEEAGVISGNHLFFAGQILYSKIRPNLNKVTIAPFNGLCSADMYPIETDLDVRFVVYIMLSNYFVVVR